MLFNLTCGISQKYKSQDEGLPSSGLRTTRVIKMMEQDIKRGKYKNIEGTKLFDVLSDVFGEAHVSLKDGKCYVTYGALSPLIAWVKDKSTLMVDTIMDPDVDIEAGLDSRKKYNKFLDIATGFNAKARTKRLKDKAKKSK